MDYRDEIGSLVIALTAGLLAACVCELSNWPYLNLQSWTWLSVGSVWASVTVAMCMYLGVLGTTRGMQALFACALLALSIANFLSIERIEAALAKHASDGDVILYIVRFTKHATSIGVGALAVSLLANTFPVRAKPP